MTPPHFFKGFNSDAEKACADGLRATRYLAKKTDLCIVDSAFNKMDLLAMGYDCPMEVLPILIAFDDYKKEPDKKVIKAYDDDWVNVVFTGRVAPNKCPEDIIAAFYYYKKNIQPKSRLFLVGRYDGVPAYKAQLLAYYHIADVFVCLSEHEGFCVPLVEAMYFGVPIIAYDSTAIGDTLGGSGLLLQDKSPAVVGEAIHLVTESKELRNQLVKGEKERLKDFYHDKIKKDFLEIMKKFLAEDKK